MTKEQFEAQTLALRDTMHRVAASLLARPHDRADAIQSCLLRAWQHRERLRDEAHFRPWLLRILVNECHTVLRKSRRMVLTGMPDAPQQMPDSGIRDAIQALPERLRLPVMLHYVEDLPIREVAQAMGIPEGTVKSRLSRARALLKSAICEEV